MKKIMVVLIIVLCSLSNAVMAISARSKDIINKRRGVFCTQMSSYVQMSSNKEEIEYIEKVVAGRILNRIERLCDLMNPEQEKYFLNAIKEAIASLLEK